VETLDEDKAIVNVRVLGTFMPTDSVTSPTEARKNFFQLLDRAGQDHEVITISRRDGENVVLIAESDLAGLMETAYLLKSPRNAQRLFEALERSIQRDQQPVLMQRSTEAIAQLRQELRFDEEEG
jgi:antitoxin YefM